MYLAASPSPGTVGSWGDQAALEGIHKAALALDQPAADGKGDAVRGELEHLDVLVGEHPRRERSDVQHADDPGLQQQRHPEQRFQALLPKDRVEDVRLVDIVDPHGLAPFRDAPGEAPADRNPHLALDLLLEALRGANEESSTIVLQQQDRGGVHLEELGDADEQLREYLLEREVRERCVGNALQSSKPILCHALGHGS